jgi:hypothetical protein
MKTLASLIADIPQDDKLSVESIVAYLNRRPQTVAEGAAQEAKSATRATLEAALRAILDAMGFPTPLLPGTLASMLALTPQSDAHRDALSRAIAIRSDLKSVEHGLTDADFLSDDFGSPTRTVPTRTVTEDLSLAETHLGVLVTAQQVRAALKEKATP